MPAHRRDTARCKPLHWFIEANFSGDKKSTYLGLITGRGRKVTACVTIPGAAGGARVCMSASSACSTMPQMAKLGALLSGQLGAQGHYANGLAAFYIATGQDAACVAESAIGFTRMERRGDDLFVSVTLPEHAGRLGRRRHRPAEPGGGALRLLGLQGDPARRAALGRGRLAALCLCGEISIIGAIAAGHFTRAHAKLARDRR